MFRVLQKEGAPFFAIYLVAFLFAFHIALPLYINSSFLEQFISESNIGFVYIAASILILFFLGKFPAILARLGNYKTVLLVLGAQMVFLLLLASPLPPPVLIFAFIFMQVFITLGLFNLDVFLERFSEDATTGAVRGIMLTALNLGILLGPLIAGVILSNNEFWKIYLISAVFLLPVSFIITRRLKYFKDPEYVRIPYFKTLRGVLTARHPNDEIRHAIIANFLLRFFFSWMVIYTPLYLHKYIGFAWSEVGIILAIMLLPFVLFEIPMGWLADTHIGEKRIMIVGFFIMSFFTATLFFVENPSLVIWAALLFGTRIGASFVEITSESYFFKHIDSTDIHLLSIFRNSRPVAYITGPLVASLLLFFTDIQHLFPILAIILLYGIWNTFKMRPVSVRPPKASDGRL